MSETKITPREYHARQEAEALQKREELRLERLADARVAIRQIAPDFPKIRAIYLFGSILIPGRFTSYSDIDVAVACNHPADCIPLETPFWRRLEAALECNVDVRPYEPPLVQAIADYGECVYARESDHS